MTGGRNAKKSLAYSEPHQSGHLITLTRHLQPPFTPATHCVFINCESLPSSPYDPHSPLAPEFERINPIHHTLPTWPIFLTPPHRSSNRNMAIRIIFSSTKVPTPTPGEYPDTRHRSRQEGMALAGWAQWVLSAPWAP